MSRRPKNPCPACSVGTLIPDSKPRIVGPHTSRCDHCGWTLTQIIDNKRNIRERNSMRRKTHGPRPA